MDLFQLNIYINPIAYPFVIKSIKDFLSNNNLLIKKEGSLFINSYPTFKLQKQILIETAYEKKEVKKICAKMQEFIYQYNSYHPNSNDLELDLIDIKSQKEFKKSSPKFFKQIKWILAITIISFLAGYLLANLNIQKTAKINGQELTIEEVKKENDLSIGLSKYKSISSNHGMLFIFPKKTTRAFWMKNMYFSIDLFFLDENYKIIDIKENQPPCPITGECILIESKQAYNYVIETKANFASLNKIKIGDKFEISNQISIID